VIIDRIALNRLKSSSKPHPPAPSPSEKGSRLWVLKLPSLKERGWG